MGVTMKGLLTVFVMLTVCCALTLADKANCNKGVITPVDPYFLEGQDLVLTCTRYNTNASRHLHFLYSNGYNRTMVDEKYVERNRTAVTVRIPNITADDVSSNSVSTSYYCYDKRKTKDVCIQNEYVVMDYYPKKAEDIKCIIDNWDSMTCTWDLAVQYKNPTHYDVSCRFVQNFSSEWDNNTVAKLLYAFSPHDKRWATCPDGNKTSCHWDSSVFEDPKMYIIKINVTNTRKNITTYTDKTIYTKDIVKPAPVNPSEIAVTYLDDPEHVHIQWNHSQIYVDLLFNLTLISACDLPKVVELPYIPDLHLPEPIPAQVTLTGLNPNTRYNFTLTAKGLEGSGPWSEPTKNYFTTLPAVPRSVPDTRNGLFEELQGKCDTKNCKEVQVYFKPLMKCEKISNTTKYLLSALKNETIESSKFSAVVNVPRNKSSTVHLRAFSQEGVSTNYSSQQIYPENEWSKIHVQRELVIEYNAKTGVCNATIVILKKAINFVNISHTIVWCKGGAVCEKPVDWYTMAQNQTSTILPVSHCERRYRVGITTSGRREATGEIIATGISWVHCMYEEGKVPQKPLPDAEIYNSSAYRFKITWTPYSCDTPDINYVEYYRVSYCSVSGIQNCSCTEEMNVTMNVSKLENSVTVPLNNSIEIGSKFCVWVEAKTRGGFGPRNTNDLYFTVGDDAVRDDAVDTKAIAVSAIVSAVVAGVFLLVLGFFFYICRDRWRKFRKRFKTVQIDTPLPLISQNETGHPHTACDLDMRDGVNTLSETESLLPHDSGTSSLSSKSSVTDTQSNRNSNDSGIHRIEMVRNNLEEDPLFSFLEEPATGSGTYNSMPKDFDIYDLDTNNSSSVGATVHELEKQNVDEHIYGEIDSSEKTNHIKHSNVSLDQISNTDSALVTEDKNILSSFTNEELSRYDSVSSIEQDGFLYSESAHQQNNPEAVIIESQGKESECTVNEVPEDLQMFVNKNTVTRDEETDVQSFPDQCGNSNKDTVTRKKEGTVSEFQSCLDQCGNQNINFDDDDDSLANGYAKPGDLLIESQTGSNFSDSEDDDLSESLSNSGISDLTSTKEHSDSPTSHHIPHITSRDNKLASVQDSNFDTGINTTSSKSNKESLMINDTVDKERTPAPKAIQQKHAENNKLANSGASGESYSKVTLSASGENSVR